MSVLILGARGQFGSALEARCIARGIPFLSPPREVVDLADTSSLADFISEKRPKVVVNAAGLIDFPACERTPEAAFSINATAIRGLAEVCRAREVSLVQTSTHLVFRGDKEDAYLESDLPCPGSIYAASKFAGESIAQTRNPMTYVVRFPTLFGTRRNGRTGFVERMIQRLQRNEPVSVATDRIDSPTWTTDAADQILDVILEHRPFGLYHIANQGQVSYFDLVKFLATLLGSRSDVSRARDSDFPSEPPKPLKVAIASCRLPFMRHWQDALAAYVETDGLTR